MERSVAQLTRERLCRGGFWQQLLRPEATRGEVLCCGAAACQVAGCLVAPILHQAVRPELQHLVHREVHAPMGGPVQHRAAVCIRHGEKPLSGGPRQVAQGLAQERPALPAPCGLPLLRGVHLTVTHAGGGLEHPRPKVALDEETLHLPRHPRALQHEIHRRLETVPGNVPEDARFVFMGDHRQVDQGADHLDVRPQGLPAPGSCAERQVVLGTVERLQLGGVGEVGGAAAAQGVCGRARTLQQPLR
mmetsp:Transcript_98308/g.311869  ORF Transcript_98308/g.311869 Transcript_98308/m.311869 type:complete len:247 (+) Transcript_98308:22-762(+)